MRNPDTPDKVVALEVNVSATLSVIVICPCPLLTVGFKSVQMAIRRLVPMITWLAGGHDTACSLPEIVVSGSHCTDEMVPVEVVCPTVTRSARFALVLGTE